MRWLLTALPGLACAAMMLIVCVPLLMHRKDDTGDTVSKQEIGALRAEIAELEAERSSPEHEHV